MTLTKEKEATHKIAVRSAQEQAEQPRKKKIKAKKKSAEQAAALKKDLLGRLQHLRSVARETTTSYLSNLERSILEAMDTLSGDAGRNGRARHGDPRTLKRLIRRVDQLSVKPEKGRRKDLKKLERAVDALLDALS